MKLLISPAKKMREDGDFLAPRQAPALLERAAVLAEILRRAKEEPEALHAAPASTPVGRPDETAAARRPVVRYAFPEG